MVKSGLVDEDGVWHYSKDEFEWKYDPSEENPENGGWYTEPEKWSVEDLRNKRRMQYLFRPVFRDEEPDREWKLICESLNEIQNLLDERDRARTEEQRVTEMWRQSSQRAEKEMFMREVVERERDDAYVVIEGLRDEMNEMEAQMPRV